MMHQRLSVGKDLRIPIRCHSLRPMRASTIGTLMEHSESGPRPTRPVIPTLKTMMFSHQHFMNSQSGLFQQGTSQEKRNIAERLTSTLHSQEESTHISMVILTIPQQVMHMSMVNLTIALRQDRRSSKLRSGNTSMFGRLQDTMFILGDTVLLTSS